MKDFRCFKKLQTFEMNDKVRTVVWTLLLLIHAVVLHVVAVTDSVL